MNNQRYRNSAASPSESINLCFVCGAKVADTAHPIIVRLKKSGQFTEIMVPACQACRIAEWSASRRASGTVLAIMVVPIILGAILGRLVDAGWQGAFAGLGVGFFGGIIIWSLATGRGKSCQHPAIKALQDDGWHFDHLYYKV
jgi:hypothetical protein